MQKAYFHLLFYQTIQYGQKRLYLALVMNVQVLYIGCPDPYKRGGMGYGFYSLLV
jgi:hypothetical protein